MKDHGNNTIKVNCASCNLIHKLTLNQIANEESILCECGELMIFKDGGGAFKKLIVELNAQDNSAKNGNEG
ncbi:hypothetical protein BH11BAC7_BH11BAC7_34500 [soil metagenome]